MYSLYRDKEIHVTPVNTKNTYF